MNFHILTENKAKKAGILAEHGLSVFIQYKDENYLFGHWSIRCVFKKC